MSTSIFTFPFFSQVICGSGSPVTLQESSKGCPSLTAVSTRRVEKSGGHIASSGDTRKKTHFENQRNNTKIKLFVLLFGK